MKVLIFFDSKNHPPRKPHDGDEFRDRAKDAENFYREKIIGKITLCDLHINSVEYACKLIAEEKPDRILFFSHGTQRTLAGRWATIKSPRYAPIQGLIDAVNMCPADARIGLYACLTGGLPAGKRDFAESLSVGCGGRAVLSHTAGGHTTRNPNIIIDYKGKVLTRKYFGLTWSQWVELLKNKPFRPFEILEQVP
ncbi:MAG: hypothetical protein ABFC56_07440 [Clostridiaceae bacterium]